MANQQDQEGANEFTAFLGLGTPGGGLETDLSQYGVDLTANGTDGVYELISSRLELLIQRTVRVRFEASNTSEGSLFYRNPSGTGTTGTGREDVYVQSGSLYVAVNDSGSTTPTIRTIIALPGVGASASGFVAHWAYGANPDTTGASDSMLHEVVVENEATGLLRRDRFTTGALEAVTSGVVAIGQRGTSSSFVFDGTLVAAAIDGRRLPFTYTHEWALGATAAPGSSETSHDVQSLPVLREIGWGDASNFFGPQALVAAQHHQTSRRRTFSPLVNERFTSPITIEQSGGLPVGPDTNTAKFWQAIPGGSYYLMLGWLRVRRVPDLANALFCRVHARCNTTSGSAMPIGFRVYSSDHHSIIRGRQVHYVETVVTRDDAAPGLWVDFDLLRIARRAEQGRDPLTYLCLALAFDPADVSASTAEVTVNAWHVVPRYQPDVAGEQPRGGI